jgi:hypothetical protein
MGSTCTLGRPSRGAGPIAFRFDSCAVAVSTARRPSGSTPLAGRFAAQWAEVSTPRTESSTTCPFAAAVPATRVRNKMLVHEISNESRCRLRKCAPHRPIFLNGEPQRHQRTKTEVEESGRHSVMLQRGQSSRAASRPPVVCQSKLHSRASSITLSSNARNCRSFGVVPPFASRYARKSLE